MKKGHSLDVQKNVFIVVLHFGDPLITRRCIESVLMARVPYNEIIIVDNASNLIMNFVGKKIKVLRNSKNLGYAGGMNKGIKMGLSEGAKYILLLNNDAIIKVNFVTELREFLEAHTNIGIVSPAVTFHRRGKIMYDLGGKVNFLFGKTRHEEVHTVLDAKPRLVDYVSGCCMIVKKEVFDRVGFFDETFFLYYEDVDFCLRAKKFGFKTVLLPSMSIYHSLSQAVGKDSSLAFYHQTFSAVLFGKKHLHLVTRFFHTLFILAQSLYILIKDPIQGRYTFLGFFHGIR